MVPSTCGAGAGPWLSGLERTGVSVLWLWLSCSGPAPMSLTWLSTPVPVSPCHLFHSLGEEFNIFSCSYHPKPRVSSGQSFLACGDDSGRLWTYSIQNIPKSGFHSGKPVVTTEVQIFFSFVLSERMNSETISGSHMMLHSSNKC